MQKLDYGSRESELSAQNLDSEYQELDEDEDLLYFDCKALFHSFRSLQKVDVKVQSKIGFCQSGKVPYSPGSLGTPSPLILGSFRKPERNLKFPGVPGVPGLPWEWKIF